MASEVGALVSQACGLVRQLDEAIGPPPFTAPSPPAARTAAGGLVDVLRDVHRSGRTALLADHRELSHTLPVLCAALTAGAVDRRPCTILMELLLEALVYVHAISLYPLQSTLKDALEVLPHSPVTFRLFVVAGAMDVNRMRLFLGIPSEPNVEQQKGNSSKKNRQSGNQKKNVPQETNSINTNKMVEIPREILNVALDVVLPQDCIKVFISLFNSPSKFQHLVGNDTELATRVLNVYGDYVIPNLRPTSLIDCLGVSLLDTFIDVVKMSGENMSLLTDSILTKISITEWNSERLIHLIHYCIERKFYREEAFASLVVYTFLSRLLIRVSEVHDLSGFPIEDEVKLWGAVLHAAEMMPFSTGTLPTIEEERLIKPLSVLAEGIKQRYTIDSLTKVSSSISYETIIAVLQMLINSLDSKLKPINNATVGGGKKKKGSKGPSKTPIKPPVSTSSSSLSLSFTNAVDDYCKMIMESISLLLWLVPAEKVESDSGLVCHALESVAAVLLPTSSTTSTVEEKTRRMPQTSTWECFLNLLLSILNIPTMTSNTFILGQKSKVALLFAVQATHRLESCGIFAQRIPDIYTVKSWSISNYKVLLDAWVTADTHVDKFYATAFTLTSTESIELILGIMDDNSLMELVQLLLNTESSITSLISALKKVVLSKEDSNNSEGKIFTRLSRLYEYLLKTHEGRTRILEEEQQKKESEKKIRMLEAIQQKEELLANTMEFEREAQKRREAKEEEQIRIQRIREERQREKEQKREKERKEQQARREKAAALIKEMALRTKAERLAEQQERLQRYRARVSSITHMSTFLESIQLAPSRIMQVLLALRPYLPSMTHDDLLEFLVTGNRKVPNDMQTVENVDSSGNLKSTKEEERVCFSDEVPSFWESVMQIVNQDSGSDTSNTLGFVEKESEDESYSSSNNKDVGISFHKRVCDILDLFDYSTGTNETLPDLLPSLNVRHAVRLLTSNNINNGLELFLSCQQRGLCVMNNGICTLTALGFRYHFPFHDPEMMLDVQFERRRTELRAMMADVEYDDYGDEESMNSSSQEEDVVRFADELI